MVTKLGPLCKVKLLKNDVDKAVVRTEKAGVGGFNSVPGHHHSKALIQILPIVSPVRSQSAVEGRPKSRPYSRLMVKDLDLITLFSVRFQSALWGQRRTVRSRTVRDRSFS
jgi:hypothetical protein